MKKTKRCTDGSYDYEFDGEEIKEMMLEKYPRIPKERISEIGFVGDSDNHKGYFFIGIGVSNYVRKKKKDG